ncbi:MAG TPA: hypothetical protein VFV95_12325 [Vicinamibacterales bacterium]|nr:hypothetical protein [Vicinamibacterales bacterium]
MKMTVSRPIVYVAAAAATIAVLVIARPSMNRAANPAPQSSNSAAGTTGPLPDVPVVDLNLDRLKTAGRELGESERDPFRFRPKAPPPVQRVQQPPPVFVPQQPVGPPPVPQIPLRVYGTYSVGGKWVAAFRDERGNTFNGREGDILEGRYRLVRITETSVDLEYIDGRGRQTLRVTGQ